MNDLVRWRLFRVKLLDVVRQDLEKLSSLTGLALADVVLHRRLSAHLLVVDVCILGLIQGYTRISQYCYISQAKSMLLHDN